MHSTKSHYIILDGLRGVAALTVVVFHLCETYSFGNPFAQVINHGYLAVDFFFLLSGFVIAYAYDDQWRAMSSREFYIRRLIRLHPMVVMGSLIGAALFYFQVCQEFPLVATTPLWKLLVVMLIGFTLVPVMPGSLDIRGWHEMHPLNGPGWSLFFEYLANIGYASGLRRLSNRALGVLVILAAAFLVQVAVSSPRGGLIGGWSLDAKELHIGFARVLFPFFAGVLLCRLGRFIHIPWAFAACSLLLVTVLALPRFGDPQHLWINGLYESLCVLFIFPVIVLIGAGTPATDSTTTRVARVLGDLSYPLYITHYPLIYVYSSWVIRDRVPASRGALVGALALIAAVTLAYACLELYDVPVRRWLSRKFLTTPEKAPTTRTSTPGFI